MPRASEDAEGVLGMPRACLGRLSSHVSSSSRVLCSRVLQCLMGGKQGAVHMPSLAGVFADCAPGGAGLDGSPEGSLQGGGGREGDAQASLPPFTPNAIYTPRQGVRRQRISEPGDCLNLDGQAAPSRFIGGRGCRQAGRVWLAVWQGVAGWPDVIRKKAWPFCRTISGVRLCWELEEPKGPKGRVVACCWCGR